MRFLAPDECRTWCSARIDLEPEGTPQRPSAVALYARVPASNEMAFCQRLEQALQPRDACLLWVTSWGVWRSSENLHLYYRLRQSYSDQVLLHERPGHLFLDYEVPDLVSFLQVGLLSGWDMHLIPAGGYARVFVSHDGYVEFAADTSNPDLVQEFAARFEGAQTIGLAPGS
jgi:hypothetical protein